MFYRFRPKWIKGEMVVNSDESIGYEALRLGAYIPQDGYVAKKLRGKTLYDVLSFEYNTFFAISERFYQVLQDNKITGWSAFEITIQKRAEKYYGFQIVGRCGPLVSTKHPSQRNEIGREYDWNGWDTSDIFCPSDGSRPNFCTERAAKVFIDSGITNLTVTPLSEVGPYDSL